MSPLESGDRLAFLGHLRRKLATPEPPNLAHPLPPPVHHVPLVRSSLLDPDDLAGSFLRNATAAHATVHDVAGRAVPREVVAEIVERHAVQRAVVSAEAEVDDVAALLREVGVDVQPVSMASATVADLGVTSCLAAIATTGTVVQSTATTGARSPSLLPRVHVCVVPASRIVPTSAEVLRPLSASLLPSNLVLVTGPSKSGDIEQIMVTGVHGPVALELVLLREA